MKRLITGILAMSTGLLAQAQMLVAPGTTATLTVEYDYSAAGSKPDKYDPRDWKVSRKVSITAQLVADKQQPLPSMHPLDSAQQADMKGKQEKSKSVAKTMAPMAGDMMSIVAKCGEDEACITRAVQQYSSTVQMTPELKQAGADIKSIGETGPARYQMWKLVSQTGTYSVDETYNATTTEVGEGTSEKNTRSETRKGGGAMPGPSSGKSVSGAAVLEVDTVRKDIALSLPMMLGVPSVTRTVKSTVAGQSGTSQLPMPGLTGQPKTITVAIPAGLNNASGTETTKGTGAEGEGGTMKVTWRLRVQ
jgi:hypothetical protein